MADILKEISDIETRMEKGLANARKNKESIISEAEGDALKIIENKKETLQKEMDGKISAKEKDLASEKEKVSKKAQSEVDQVLKQSSKNQRKAVDFIIDSFEERLKQ